MEVSLVEADGIPEGCLISVRAGTTRRQAPVEANKPCKLSFPRSVLFANPFKVDLLAPLGNAAFEVNAGTERYPFEVKSRYSGKAMHVTLRVREDKKAPFGLENDHDLLSMGNNLSGGPHESPARRHQGVLEQRAYLDSHNLLPFIHGLLQDLIRDRPDDPWGYIDTSTARARKMSSKVRSRSSSPAKAGNQRSESSNPVSLSPFRPYYASHVVTQCPTSYWNNLHSSFPPARRRRDSAALRDGAKSTILQGLRSGALDNAIANQNSQAAAPSSSAAAVPRGSGGAIGYSASSTDTTAASTPPTRPTITRQASVRINPGDSLKSPNHGTATPMVVEEPRTSDAAAAQASTLDAVAKSVKASLLEAAISGKLSTALAEVQQEEGDVARSVRATLLKAARSGTLGAAVVQACDEPDAETKLLGKQVMQSLLKASKDGSLRKVLEEVASPSSQASPGKKKHRTSQERLFDKIDYKKDGVIDQDEMEYAIEKRLIKRPQGFVTRAEAEKQASFEKMASVGTWCVPTSSGEQEFAASAQGQGLAQRVKSSLVDAAITGNLDTALDQVMVSRQAKDAELEEIRKQAMAGLLSSVKTGVIQTVLTEKLHEEAEEQEVEDFREMAQGALLAAFTKAPAQQRTVSELTRASQSLEESSLQRVNSSGSTSVTQARRLASPPLDGLASASDLSATVASPDEARLRQERFMQDNEALRRENVRLKKLREAGDAANVLCNENDRLRTELGKLMSLHKKEAPAGFMRGSSSTGQGF